MYKIAFGLQIDVIEFLLMHLFVYLMSILTIYNQTVYICVWDVHIDLQDLRIVNRRRHTLLKVILARGTW